MQYTRARFEKICEPMFQRCLDSVKRVLAGAYTRSLFSST
jgi:L1 cell adhesion molecule like protein